MLSKKILAFSSSRSGNSGFLEVAQPVIGDFIGGKATTVAFIPFADVSKNYERYALAVSQGLKNDKVKINAAVPSNASSVIENADVIIVGGGNTFKLLHDLYELDLLGLIRQKVTSGTPYIGWSAGANILAPTISTTNDMPVIEPKSFNALKMIHFQINPHYFNKKIEGFNGETRDDRLEEFVKMNPALPVMALPEGSYLKLEKGVLQYFGQEAGFLFSSDKNDPGFSKKTIIPEENLSFLI